jgi:hypothetical protein
MPRAASRIKTSVVESGAVGVVPRRVSDDGAVLLAAHGYLTLDRKPSHRIQYAVFAPHVVELAAYP